MDIVQKKMKKNIVILGAGFGGLRCALELEKMSRKDVIFSNNFNIVLVDKNSYSLYTPSLYEVATTSKADGSGRLLKKVITTEISDAIKYKKIKFVLGEVAEINAEHHMVKFSDNTLMPYDFLVVALGAEPGYFGIEGLKEHSVSLKWLPDAIKTRNRIRAIFSSKKEGEALKVLVGGAGPNGVEFAAELPGYIRALSHIDKKNVKLEITLVDGAPTILNGFDTRAVKKAEKRIAKIGLKAINGFLISKVEEKKAYLKEAKPKDAGDDFVPKEKEVDFDILIWSGGVQVNSILKTLTMPKEKNGKMEVNETFMCVDPEDKKLLSEKIYAIGDNSCFHHPEIKRPVPGTARVAIQEAKIAAKNIYATTKNKKERFKYMPAQEMPFSIPIGGKYAITKYKGMIFTGFIGWMMKQFVELYYLYSITDRISIFSAWWKGFKIFSKND